MIHKSVQEEIEKILPISRIRYNEPMDRHCSFHTGGPADALVFVRTEGEMAELLTLLRGLGQDFFILGKGTNLLIGDGGYRGVIVTAVGADAPDTADDLSQSGQAAGSSSDAGPLQENSPALDEIRVQGNRVTAGAGATLKAVAIAARDHGLAGLEFAAGIPGTVGGGLVMNAGAYGGEMKQVVRSVRMFMPDGSLRVMTGEEMEFGYRTSVLRRIPSTALSAEFELEEGDREAIRARILELAAERRAKQPLEYPSAGSTFKRPEGAFAAALIDQCGLKGCSVGDAQVSPKHAGFVINRGNASSSQILELIGLIQQKVLDETGYQLEPEIRILGTDERKGDLS